MAATAGRDGLLADLGGPLPEAGVDALEVVEDLARAADPGLVASGGPRYFGFVIGGSLPAALAADWLTSAWDQNAGLFAAGPAASVAEEVIGAWLIDLLQLPSGTSFGLTTGCQMAHFSCLAAARHAVLDRAGWDVEERGLFGAPEIDVVIGTTLPSGKTKVRVAWGTGTDLGLEDAPELGQPPTKRLAGVSDDGLPVTCPTAVGR